MSNFSKPSRLRRILQAIRIILQAIIERLTPSIYKKYRELEKISILDPLTGVGNRRMFEFKLKEFADRQHDGILGVIVIDLDNFKAVNDNLGHVGGDLVLKKVARAICGALRPETIVCRIGGDEFVVLIPLHDRRGASPVTGRKPERERREDTSIKENAIDLKKIAVRIKIACINCGQPVSAGYSIERFSTSKEEILLGADSAMYDAKHAGRNAEMPSEHLRTMLD